MTDVKKFRNYAPFGVRTGLGAKIGINPHLDKSGASKIPITDVGPGSYDPKFPECKHKNGINWTRKLQLEDFSRNMGWKNLSVLEDRKYFQSLRGPGTHEINLALFRQQSNSSYRDISFSIGPRWSYQKLPDTPSPDRYFPDYEKRRSIVHKTFSSVPTFEHDGFVDRFRTGAAPKYVLPPNLYNIMEKDGKDITNIIKKRISIRGPYDLFTGPRNETTLKGFYCLPNFKSPEDFLDKPSIADGWLKTKNRARSGKFLQDARFPKRPTKRHMMNDLSVCYRDPNSPGPATYDMTKYGGIVAQPQSRYPFGTSKIENITFHGKATIFPGPGRYAPRGSRCMKQKRNSWVFLSTYQRKHYHEDEYRSF